MLATGMREWFRAIREWYRARPWIDLIVAAVGAILTVVSFIEKDWGSTLGLGLASTAFFCGWLVGRRRLRGSLRS